VESVTPFLWYDHEAEEAARFYTTVFRSSRVLEVRRAVDPKTGRAGPVMSVTFELAGQQIHALNGGPHFRFTPAISLFVSCRTQRDIDVLWEKLSRGGTKGRCGWLEDMYGLSWQIVPARLGRLLDDAHPERAGRVMAALMKMSKLETRALEAAYRGPSPETRRRGRGSSPR